MEDKYNLAKEILIKYNQEHLLMFYDELDDSQKEKLLKQILSIDFDEILGLYKNSYIDDDLTDIKISPIDYTVKEGFVCEECKSLVPAFGNAKELVDYLESYNPDEHGFTVLKNIEDK